MGEGIGKSKSTGVRIVSTSFSLGVEAEASVIGEREEYPLGKEMTIGEAAATVMVPLSGPSEDRNELSDAERGRPRILISERGDLFSSARYARTAGDAALFREAVVGERSRLVARLTPLNLEGALVIANRAGGGASPNF